MRNAWRVISAAVLGLLAARGLAAQDAPAGPRPGLATLFVAPMSHCDVGFTHPPSEVADLRVRGIEGAIETAETEPEFHWTLEVGWDLDLFLERHGEKSPWRARLRKLVSEDRIAVGALYVNAHAAFLTGASDLLTIHRDDAERVLGVRPETAILADVPRAPAALADALAKAGVRRLLWGPNDTFSAPAPLPRNRPFWWQGPGGGKVLTYVLDGGYFNATDRWLVDAKLARFFSNPDAVRLGDDLAITSFGIAREAARIPPAFDIALASHSFDNWGPESAQRLLAQVRAWNKTGRKPVIALATPGGFFDEVEKRWKGEHETITADMGAAWEVVRAQMPVTQARLREAMRRAGEFDWKRRRAVALAADHNIGGGPVWPGNFDREGALRHNREVGEILSRAVADIPPPLSHPGRASPWPWEAYAIEGEPLLPIKILPECFARLFGSEDAAALERPVAARAGLIPDLGPGRVLTDAPSRAFSDGATLWLQGRIFRRELASQAALPADAQIDVGWRLPLALDLASVRWEGLPPAERLVIAPGDAMLLVAERRLRLRSPVVFAYSLGPDPLRPGQALLTALILRHSESTKDKEGKPFTLPFEMLFPGEPETVQTFIEIEIR